MARSDKNKFFYPVQAIYLRLRGSGIIADNMPKTGRDDQATDPKKKTWIDFSDPYVADYISRDMVNYYRRTFLAFCKSVEDGNGPKFFGPATGYMYREVSTTLPTLSTDGSHVIDDFTYNNVEYLHKANLTPKIDPNDSHAYPGFSSINNWDNENGQIRDFNNLTFTRSNVTNGLGLSTILSPPVEVQKMGLLLAQQQRDQIFSQGSSAWFQQPYVSRYWNGIGGAVWCQDYVVTHKEHKQGKGRSVFLTSFGGSNPLPFFSGDWSDLPARIGSYDGESGITGNLNFSAKRVFHFGHAHESVYMEFLFDIGDNNGGYFGDGDTPTIIFKVSDYTDAQSDIEPRSKTAYVKVGAAFGDPVSSQINLEQAGYCATYNTYTVASAINRYGDVFDKEITFNDTIKVTGAIPISNVFVNHPWWLKEIDDTTLPTDLNRNFTALDQTIMSWAGGQAGAFNSQYYQLSTVTRYSVHWGIVGGKLIQHDHLSGMVNGGTGDDTKILSITPVDEWGGPAPTASGNFSGYGGGGTGAPINLFIRYFNAPIIKSDNMGFASFGEKKPFLYNSTMAFNGNGGWSWYREVTLGGDSVYHDTDFNIYAPTDMVNDLVDFEKGTGEEYRQTVAKNHYFDKVDRNARLFGPYAGLALGAPPDRFIYPIPASRALFNCQNWTNPSSSGAWAANNNGSPASYVTMGLNETIRFMHLGGTITSSKNFNPIIGTLDGDSFTSTNYGETILGFIDADNEMPAFIKVMVTNYQWIGRDSAVTSSISGTIEHVVFSKTNDFVVIKDGAGQFAFNAPAATYTQDWVFGDNSVYLQGNPTNTPTMVTCKVWKPTLSSYNYDVAAGATITIDTADDSIKPVGIVYKTWLARSSQHHTSQAWHFAYGSSTLFEKTAEKSWKLTLPKEWAPDGTMLSTMDSYRVLFKMDFQEIWNTSKNIKLSIVVDDESSQSTESSSTEHQSSASSESSQSAGGPKYCTITWVAVPAGLCTGWTVFAGSTNCFASDPGTASGWVSFGCSATKVTVTVVDSCADCNSTVVDPGSPGGVPSAFCCGH